MVQEIALATGRAQIQCGHNTCDFEDFTLTQRLILSEYADDSALEKDFRSCENFRATIKDFCYSSFHDREGFFTKTFASCIMRVMGMLFRDISDNTTGFHELPFAHRLNYVLLKTAGLFKCHDDRDRLYAVLGIAGSAATGKAAEMANFVKTISTPGTQMTVACQRDLLLKTFSPTVRAATIIFTLVYVSWGIFYNSIAQYWTMNRPEYSVVEHGEVIEVVTRTSGE